MEPPFGVLDPRDEDFFFELGRAKQSRDHKRDHVNTDRRREPKTTPANLFLDEVARKRAQLLPPFFGGKVEPVVAEPFHFCHHLVVGRSWPNPFFGAHAIERHRSGAKYFLRKFACFFLKRPFFFSQFVKVEKWHGLSS